MVGGDDQQVAGLQRREELREAGVEGLERAGVAGDVAGVAVERVEVDVVGEDEVAVPAASIAASVASTSAMSSLPLASVEMPRWAKMSPILPMAWVRAAGSDHPVEERRLGRRDRRSPCGSRCG